MKPLAGSDGVTDDVGMFDWKPVGKKCRKARKQLGLNQTEMAERAGIAQTTLSNIENGRTTTTSTLAALVDAVGLELRVDLFVKGETPPALPPEILEIAAAVGNLSPADRKAFIEMMRLWSGLPEDLREGTLSQWRFYAKIHGGSERNNRSTA